MTTDSNERKDVVGQFFMQKNSFKVEYPELFNSELIIERQTKKQVFLDSIRNILGAIGLLGLVRFLMDAGRKYR